MSHPLHDGFQRLANGLRSAAASLKFRLAVGGVAFTAASVAICALMVLEQVSQRGERAILAMERSNAERMASLAANRVITLQLALRAAAAELQRVDLRDGDAALRFLHADPVLMALFSSTFVANASGRVVALRDETGTRDPKLSIADRGYFRQTVEKAIPIVSDPVVGRVSHGPLIQLTMPVLGPSGVVVAVLGGSMRLSARNLLNDLTQTSEGADDPVATIVADASGRIVSHPVSSRLMKNITDEPGLQALAQEWTQQGSPIEPTALSRHSGGYFVSMAGVAGTDWMVFRVAADQALLGGPAEARRQAAWLAGGVALLGGVLLLLLLIVLLWPLRQLQSRAQTLLTGNMPIDQGWPSSGGEIGQLSTVLQQVMRERARTEHSNQALMQRMHSVMAAAPIGIAFTRERNFELVSRAFATLLGYEECTLIGRPAREIYASNDAYELLGPRVAEAFAAGRPFFEEMQFLRADGSVFWGRLQGSPVEAGNPNAGSIWLLEDVTQRRAAREQLAWSANHDALSGLLNRQAFESRLSALLAAPRDPSPICVLFIDLDRFKQVNDSAGHAAGDQVLKDVADLLTASARSSDTVARLGGDEFALILARCEEPAALRVAHKIRAGASQIGVSIEGRRLCIGASIGLVEVGPEMADVATVLRLADAACYEAKHAGRDAVRQAPKPPELLVIAGGG